MDKRWPAIALIVLAAACSSSAKAVVPSGSGNVGGETGVIGSGEAKQNVRADLAFVVVEPGGDNSVSFNPGDSSTSLTSHQRDEVRTKVHALGVATSAVSFDTPAAVLGQSTGTTVRVEIPVAQLPTLAAKMAAAIESVMGGQTTAGLRFAVSDCSAAVSTARPTALADAQRQAAALARAAHVSLGELRSVTEGAADPISAAYVAASGSGQPCGRVSAETSGLLSQYGNGNGNGLLALDAKPEVELTYPVSASYALGPPADRTLTATGSGDTEGTADQADILVGPGDGGLSGSPSTITAQGRARLVAVLVGLGIAKRDIEVETQGGDALSYVRVHLSISKFRSSGTKVVDAVKAVVDQAQAGVVFTSSECEQLVSHALDQAVADADKRLTRLAGAAKVRVGDIVGLDEPTATPVVGPPLGTCQPDFSAVDLSGGTIGLELLSAGLGTPGGLSLQSLDAEPRVSEHVSVSMTRAIAG